MPANHRTLRAHEWIGLRVRILSTPDLGLVGLTGKIEDESRNMFTMKVNDRLLRVPKEKSRFEVELGDNQSAIVEGESIGYRPEDRVKRGLGKW